ncbi:MAG TPA: DUF3159 domain-containing protein [Frankiaceae bacterium]|nr:DUF3159 domain-containing protein [Frankiaceae bacterium]
MKGLDTQGKDVDEILEEVVGGRRAGQDPKELFGGPRDWVDSALPPAAFVITNVVTELRTAVYVAIATTLVLVLVRLVMKETLRHAFSGVFGVAISAFIAMKTGEAKNFFVVGIATNVLYGVGFLVSVLVRHPMVGVIMRLVLDKYPKEWHEHPRVRRAYSEATLGWSAMFLLRFAVQSLLYKEDQVGLLAAAKIGMGYPLFLALLAVTLPYVKWRTRDVPVPESAAEDEAEAGGEDAGDHAPEPVGEGSGA